MRVAMTEEELKERSDLILEGKISFLYQGGFVERGRRYHGIHWFFDQAGLGVLKAPNGLAKSGVNSTAFLTQLGFWTTRGNADEQMTSRVGDSVKVYLRLEGGEAGVMLRPIRIIQDPEVLKLCPPNVGRVREYPPMHVSYGFLSNFKPYARDLSHAANNWMSFVDGVKIEIWPSLANDPPPPQHFTVSFGSVSDENWAETYWLSPDGLRPGPTGGYHIVFNDQKHFSPPGERPGPDQGDMLTVLMHELGHAMGVDHVNADPSCVMRDGLAPGEWRSLGHGDLVCMKELLK